METNFESTAAGITTYRFADVACADIHTLQALAIAATSTSVDGHTWRFKEGVCCCSKFFPHIYTYLTWHALSFSPLIINTCQVTGKAHRLQNSFLKESSKSVSPKVLKTAYLMKWAMAMHK